MVLTGSAVIIAFEHVELICYMRRKRIWGVFGTAFIYLWCSKDRSRHLHTTRWDDRVALGVVDFQHGTCWRVWSGDKSSAEQVYSCSKQSMVNDDCIRRAGGRAQRTVQIGNWGVQGQPSDSLKQDHRLHVHGASAVADAFVHAVSAYHLARRLLHTTFTARNIAVLVFIGVQVISTWSEWMCAGVLQDDDRTYGFDNHECGRFGRLCLCRKVHRFFHDCCVSRCGIVEV